VVEGLFDADPHLLHLRYLVSRCFQAALALPDLWRMNANSCRAAGRFGRTPKKLAGGHVNAWRQLERILFEIHTHPQFGIGQRALLLRTPQGKCPVGTVSALLDEATISLIRGLGGLRSESRSHTRIIIRACRTGHVPLIVPFHLHAADAAWIMRPDPAIRLWQGEKLEIAQGVTLLRLGGHLSRRQRASLGGRCRGTRRHLERGYSCRWRQTSAGFSFLWSYPI